MSNAARPGLLNRKGVILFICTVQMCPSAEFETSLNTDGDGGERGEEADAGTQRAGKTSG